MGRLNFNKRLARYRVKKTFKESIEPEEILLDAARSSKLGGQKIEVPISRNNFRIFLAIVFGGFLLFSGQAAYLQVYKGFYFSEAAEKNHIRSVPVLASRGIIYDRSMRQLVYNVPSFDLVISLPDLPQSSADRQAIFDKVTNLTGVDREEIKDILRKAELKKTSVATVFEALDHEKLLMLQEEIGNWPGFRIEENTTRQYVSPLSFSHILGYLGKLTLVEAEKNPNYFLTEKIGKNGLEFFYEDTLRGVPGEKLVEVDALGHAKRELSENKPQDGRGLVLSIDNFLQESFFSAASKVLKENKLKRAAVVAMNPKTGEILAMLSFPDFDNNSFAQGLSVKNYAELSQNPDRPLFNRAVSGQYPPGSTIKPIIGSAALQEKVVNPLTKVSDISGELILTSQYGSGSTRFGDWKAHGVVDLYSAIAQSCNVYFYTVGGGYGNIKGLGLERLEKYFKLFGFGKMLGIDLPGEGDGLVPSEAWKKQVKNEPWYMGDTYHISIGQGDLLVTPLQMAAATSAIVNGGKILAPHLVDKIIDSDKNIIKTVEKKVLSENFIDPANLTVIKEAMRQTVTVGSARLLNNLPIALGAKTGTAQVAGQRNSNAWATAFAPIDDPQVVMAVLVENAGEGSQIAVPIIKGALEEYFARQGEANFNKK